MTGHQNAALQAILAGLNGLGQESKPMANNTSTSVIPGLGLLQAETSSKVPVISSPKPNGRSPAPPVSLTPPIPDASTITAWPAAVKHITKHIAPKEITGGKIRALITEQHKHERQWWEGRQLIVAKHRSRAETQLQATALLRSLGGVAGSVRDGNREADRVELEAYDKKVYGELMKVTAEFDRKLRGMGVPFYAIKHELVMAEGVDEMGKLDRGELRELQGRVIQLLEDLFLE